jgi:pimeloyl-ACP methyl ester carboxylesterase
MNGRNVVLVLCLLAMGWFVGVAEGASRPPLATEEFRINSDTPGIQLYLRNKHLASLARFSPEKTLLFVHGATYPAETAYDLPLDGLSWMDYVAAQGYDVYLVDIRGYGRSTRPVEMEQPADRNPPIVRTEVAVRDVAAAVDFILKRRNIVKLDLLGWSWGTSIMGWYTTQHNGNVNKLVLYAPQWVRDNPSLTDPGNALGAYRVVPMTETKARWLTGVPAAKQAELIPEGWYDMWAAATAATDSWGEKQTPQKLRAPNGVVQDSREFWSAGKALYDPAGITVPVLIIHAEWDHDLPSALAQGYFAHLTNAPYKRFVEVGEGTHSIIMEKNRLQLFREVQQFLDEPWPSRQE